MRMLLCLQGAASVVNRTNLSRAVGWLILTALFPIVLLAGCGQEASEESAALLAEDTAEMAAVVSQSAPADAFPEPGPGFGASEKRAVSVDGMMAEAAPAEGGPASLVSSQRRTISRASVSVEVEEVQRAVERVNAIAEAHGGFVEQLSSSGSGPAMRADLTVRVLQENFTDAVLEIQNLGEVQDLNLGQEDVTEQFIDLEARLKSAQREEESLLSLLDRASSIEHVLTIERELSRVRSQIERLQGQLNHLQQRADLATIHVSLFPPEGRLRLPPSAHLSIEETGVSARVNELSKLVESLNGEIEWVSVTTHDGRENADVAALVPPEEFSKVVSFLERRGEVVYKEVQEGTRAGGEFGRPLPDNPEESRVSVNFYEPEPLGLGPLIIAVLAGGVILVVLVIAFVFTYQRGRNRRDRFYSET